MAQKNILNNEKRSRYFKYFVSILPGLLLTIAVTVAAYYLNVLIQFLIPTNQSPISNIFIAIILGLAIKNLISLPKIFNPGISFSIKKVLKLGIILMGIRLSTLELVKIAGVAITVVLICILLGLIFTIFIAKKFKLPAKLGTLIAVGTSICGATAIVAAGPAIEAEDEEIAYAIGTITIFGIITMFSYPYLTHLLFGFNDFQSGIFMGTAIHETAQVAGAGLMYDQLWIKDKLQSISGADVAIITKLVRNIFMILVIPLMVYYHNKTQVMKERKNINFLNVFPLFIIGFIIMALLRSLGDQLIIVKGLFWNVNSWNKLWGSVQVWSGYFLSVAMAGVGLSTDVKKFKNIGVKPFLVGLLAALFVGLMSFILILVLKPFLSSISF